MASTRGCSRAAAPVPAGLGGEGGRPTWRPRVGGFALLLLRLSGGVGEGGGELRRGAAGGSSAPGSATCLHSPDLGLGGTGGGWGEAARALPAASRAPEFKAGRREPPDPSLLSRVAEEALASPDESLVTSRTEIEGRAGLSAPGQGPAGDC